MAEAGLQNVETYVSRLHDTVVQYIATRPIMELCLVEKRRTGPRVTKSWWEQDGLDLVGMRTSARESEKIEGQEETDGTGMVTATEK